MSRTIDEQYLRFEFGDGWHVQKYDGHPDFVNKIQKLTGTKAMDFVGVCEEALFLIEVKDFRAHRPENKDRFDGDLWDEVALKVRDTLSGLLGAYRTSSDPAQWTALVRCLTNRSNCVRVVLWLEDDALRRPDDAKARATVLTSALRPKLRWLTTHVLVVTQNTHGSVPPDLRVSNLPGAAGHAHLHPKAGEITE